MNKKKSIPIFIVCGKSPLSSHGGGYSTYALNLARILHDLGYNVYILALGKKNEKTALDFGTLLIFKSFLLDYNTTALPSLPFASYIFSRGIKNIVKKDSIDKFIVWGVGPWGLTGSFLKRKYRNKLVFINNYFTTVKHEWHGGLSAVTVNDYGVLLKLKFFIIYHTIVRILSLFEKVILNSADAVITNYKSTEKILQGEFGINPSKMVRTTFLIKVYARQTDNATKEINKLPKKYILYLSRHDPRKGINYLLHAIKILKDQNKLTIPVVIAGKGELWMANKNLAKKLNITDVVQFPGFIDNPTQILKNATIFCFPTIEEGAGALIINEAMSLGVPILTTECDGIPEDIDNGKSGVLVPIANSEALAKKLLYLLDNPDFTKRLGQNASKSFHQKYNLEKMKKDIESLLNRVMN